MKIGDKVTNAVRIEKSFRSPEIPPYSLEGQIRQKDNIRDWLVRFDGINMDIPVCEEEIEPVKSEAA